MREKSYPIANLLYYFSTIILKYTILVLKNETVVY